MYGLLASVRNHIARHTVTFRLTLLVAFIAMFISWNQRVPLLSLIKRISTTKTRPTVVFAIGTPFTDKDTFIASLAHDFHFQQVIVGPWLTSLRNRKDEIGALARKYWEKQVPMPANHLVPLLRAHLYELMDNGTNRFLIDGFPRTKESAEAWDKKVGKHDLTIYFETPKLRAEAQYAEVIKERLDSVSGKDEQKLVEQRFEEHENEMDGVMEYLNSKSRVVKIPAPDDSRKSYAKVLNALKLHSQGAKLFE